jgi:phage I-like protein
MARQLKKTTPTTTFQVDCDQAYLITPDKDNEPPGQIMFMPAGKHAIRPMVNGEPRNIDVEIDSTIATTLQEALERGSSNSKVRMMGDFDHKPGPAAFFPKRFVWKENEGVFLDVDWTDSGKRAVKGRDYSYFSPSFLMEQGKIKGLPKYTVGGMTNTPAFGEMQRIAASDSDANDLNPKPKNGTKAGQHNNTMSQILTQCVALGLVTETDDEVKASTQLVTSYTALQRKVEAAEALVESHKARELEAQKATAVAAVDAAIKEGRLPGKNERIKSFWVNAMQSDPEATKETLASMTPNPVLSQTFQVKVGDSGQRIINGTSVQEQLQVKLSAVRAANPHLSIEDCYVIVQTENPELIAASDVEIPSSTTK